MAEDCLQEAFCKALEKWPEAGIPNNPAAWLITVGRNAGIDVVRRDKTESGYKSETCEINTGDVPGSDQSQQAKFDLDTLAYRDDVLRLLFCCCHPELSPQDQMALALKIVCGLPVKAIARAFLCMEKAMEQRITRAKKKAQTVIGKFTTPLGREQEQRVAAVTTLIYLLFNEGYSNTGGDKHIDVQLCKEAIRLSRMLLTLFPDNTEIMGLLALCLLQHARYPARTDKENNLVTLDKQQRQLWDKKLIEQGVVTIDKALRKRQWGTFQLQAAIAAEHCKASLAEATRWDKILMYYDALYELQPTSVIILNRAVAVSKTAGPEAALLQMESIAAKLDNYLYFHSTLAGLLLENGNQKEAKVAFKRALALNPSQQEKAYIDSKLEELEQNTIS